ncbi:MAG: nitrogenase component 1 [Holophaga sp.]|nr:nitrogenase component 1 [Holophaga sp.]
MSAHFIEHPRYTCSLGGATFAVNALPGGIPILHAPAGCAGSFAWAQNGGSALQVGGNCGSLSIPSSNLQESEVVFGGEARLRQQVKHTLEVVEGGLYVILTSCVTEIVGDDILSVVKDFKAAGVPIVGAKTGGFKGNAYHGYDILLQALFKDFLEPRRAKVRGKVNLWGIAPYLDPFWRGNLLGARRLLESLGLEVNSFFTLEDSLEAIRNAAEAELNVVVSDVYGIEAAEVFQERHGTPFLATSLPIGPSASSAFLEAVAERLELDRSVLETVLQAGNGTYYKTLEALTDCYQDMDLQRYAVVVGDGNYAVALTRFLAEDLGWLPELTVCTDQLDEDEKGRLTARLGQVRNVTPHLVFETDGSEVIGHLNRRWPRAQGQRYYDAFSPAFVLGSSFERELAQAIGAPHLSISFPVANRAILNRGYTGFGNGLTLVEDLLGAIVNGR